MAVTFTNLTRANEIGANCYHLDFGNSGLLLDAGVHPKVEGALSKPALERIQRKDIHALLLSHCHLDHVGALPVAAHQHPEMEIVMTIPSHHLVDRILHNSVNIMVKQREELNLIEYPFFTHAEVDRLTGRYTPAPFRRPVPLDWQCGDTAVSFHEAGHIQGAAGILIEHEGRRIFYTGDVNFRDQKITRHARFPEEPVDVLIAETTRGGKEVSPDWSWESEEAKLGRAIREVFERGGSVLIPIFALGKTQEMLFMVSEMMKSGILQQQTVYIGGLGNTFTSIHDQLAGQSPRLHPEFKFKEQLDIQVIDHEMAREIQIGAGRLMLMSAGMMTPQTSSHILGQRMLNNPLHGMFFVGYCDPDSPAAKIIATPPMGEVRLDREGPLIQRRCHVQQFDFSSHCNRDEMIAYMKQVRPKTVMLVHGDTNALRWFEEKLKTELPDARVVIPESGREYEI
jgi:Cft2 family RNA processing exonuclease